MTIRSTPEEFKHLPRMTISPEQLTRALADPTRLRILILLQSGTELCVCELIEALETAQPKISRHLAVLREKAILLDRRKGLWIYYRLHPELPDWALDAIRAVARGSSDIQPFVKDQQRLIQLQSLPTTNCG